MTRSVRALAVIDMRENLMERLDAVGKKESRFNSVNFAHHVQILYWTVNHNFMDDYSCSN